MPTPSRQSRTVEHDEHPGDQQDAADGLRDDLTEEVGHRRDVAVDALDQLARRVAAVELVVEAEHVAGHAQAQLVRRAPRGDRRVAGDDDGDDLGRRRRWRGTPGRGGRTSPCRRPSVAWSTIAPHDERAGQRQRRADAQERAEDGPTASVGPQQGEQGAPARRGRRRHGRSLPPERPSPTRWVSPAGRAGRRVCAGTLGAWRTTPRRSIADRRRRRRRARRGGAPRRGDLDRRDVRRLLTPPVT